MDILKKVWGYSFQKRSKVSELVIGVIVWLLIGLVISIGIWACSLLTGIPVIGAILALALRIVGALIDLYVLVGIVLMFLDYFKVFKDEQ